MKYSVKDMVKDHKQVKLKPATKKHTAKSASFTDRNDNDHCLDVDLIKA